MALSLRDKIFRRAGHLVFEYEDQMCIWGGFTERVPMVKIPFLITYYCNHTFKLKIRLVFKVDIEMFYSRSLSLQIAFQKMKTIYCLPLKYFNMIHVAKIGIVHWLSMEIFLQEPQQHAGK